MYNFSMLKNMSYKTMNGLQCFDIQHTKYCFVQFNLFLDIRLFNLIESQT